MMKLGVSAGKWARIPACAAVLVVLLAVGGSGSASAAETHVFDAQLSLTGSCGVTAVDPIPDPGCPEGVHPPKGSFRAPKSIATDDYGNIYVDQLGPGEGEGVEGRIDVFNPEGFFITEVADPKSPQDIAVDSEGNLYVFNYKDGVAEVVRYEPLVYNGAAGEITYGAPGPSITGKSPLSFQASIAIDHANDHLFVNVSHWLTEYGSAAEGNKLLEDHIGEGNLGDVQGQGIAVDAAHQRLYANDVHRIRVFELGAPHNLLLTIEGSAVPGLTRFSDAVSVAADEATGHFFIYDGGGSNKVYEFAADGSYVSTIEHEIQDVAYQQIEIDNGPESPNGGQDPDGRYLFVPSRGPGPGHAYAFGPQPPECEPVVESAGFAEVTGEEAELRATINPCNVSTTYFFQYTTLTDFEQGGFAGAATVGSGNLPAGAAGVAVSTALSGLSPATSYRFRVVAANKIGEDEAEDEFTTYPSEEGTPACGNALLRSGQSSLLPDCRAYELVTPANTNARSPIGVGHLGIYFTTREASPAGDKLSFQIEGGAIPGFEATGSFAGDPYLASRGASGWSTATAGPNGLESPAVRPGSTSPDQGFSFWGTGSGGTAAVEGRQTDYVRYPDGHSELVGQGGLGTDPQAQGRLISENGGHIVFASTVQLEENAAPSGKNAIYDRTPDGVTHVVSLLPGDVETSEAAAYDGASRDGRGIAFAIDKTLYLRFDDEETYEIGESVTFAGVSEGGGRIFYLKNGDLFAFDVASESVIPFTNSGDVVPVNVSGDGTTAYFVSPTALPVEENPQEAFPQPGAENLYLSKEGAVSFVGTVTERDVKGESGSFGNEQLDGLGLWVDVVGMGKSGADSPGKLGADPSRTTPDGNVLLFESRAALTGYDSGGKAEIYRYVSGESLDCLSCNPTQAPATGSASLESISQAQEKPEPFSSFVLVDNLRADGRRAFFQSPDPLVPTDTDGLQDVYEWEAQGEGSCGRPGGCVYLISSGHSDRVDYLYAVSDSGDDVFFRTADLLLPADSDETPSIYDARVNGGFPEEAEAECQGEGCRPGMQSPPQLAAPGAPAPGASDNLHRPKHCAKGKRRVKRHGKVRCVKRHRNHPRHQSGPSKKGGR